MSDPPPPPPRPGRWILLGTAALAVAGAWWALGRLGRHPSGREALPPPYRNTAPDVAYVGRQVCVECHEGQYKTYLHTTHSRAFAAVDVDQEPPDGTYHHEKSGLDYRVERVGRRLRMTESVQLADGSSAVLAAHDVPYVAGSGSHSRSYVLPTDGFFVEAPVTWFTQTQAWGMSPGYDRPFHESFSRAIDKDCLFCHVGRVETVGQTTHKMRVLEDAVGCERCHGPGALHVARWRGGREPTGERDLTIVNPLELPPAAQLDLCGQCHLDQTLTVPAAARRMDDWRPGLPMKDFRTTYRPKDPSKRMTVVGHVGQLSRSRCFRASGTMSCLTCHDPHDTPGKAEARAWFRQRCFQCHEPEGACGLDPADPERMAHGDDCLRCHMPRSETDIPHFAFTHHRVGLHDLDASPEPVRPPRVQTLVPAGDVTHFTQPERDRNLGLAYLMLAFRRPDDPRVVTPPEAVWRAYLERARELLERALSGRADDPRLRASLAYLAWERNDLEGALGHAQAALADEGAILDPEVRVRALEVLAEVHYERREGKEAAAILDRLVRLRRHAEDWVKIATLRTVAGDRRGALTAALQAGGISPQLPHVQELMARAYERIGDTTKAAYHRRIARTLQQKAQVDGQR